MLRQLLESNPETLQDFDLAADEKYWEGLELLTAGRHGGGIYLMGYSAEMILKYAAFRIQGYPAAMPVAALFGPVRRYMSARVPAVEHESYHSLLFWLHYLRERRRDFGRLFPPAFDVQLIDVVERLYELWWVDMRYRPDRSTPEQAVGVYNDVSWLRMQQPILWS